MHFVSLRARARVPSVKKGTIVRDFLRAAFERMRPGNVRNDAALEWRLYNILWYHYFKYHLPNPQTAARLGIGSMRQFYREQDRAIQTLLKELLDIEAEAMDGDEV